MASVLRSLSLGAASAVSLALFAWPRMLGAHLTADGHVALAALLAGVSGAFVYGFGYTPERRAWRTLFSPAVAWTFIIAGASWLSA